MQASIHHVGFLLLGLCCLCACSDDASDTVDVGDSAELEIRSYPFSMDGHIISVMALHDDVQEFSQELAGRYDKASLAACIPLTHRCS